MHHHTRASMCDISERESERDVHCSRERGDYVCTLRLAAVASHLLEVLAELHVDAGAERVGGTVLRVTSRAGAEMAVEQARSIGDDGARQGEGSEEARGQLCARRDVRAHAPSVRPSGTTRCRSARLGSP